LTSIQIQVSINSTGHKRLSVFVYGSFAFTRHSLLETYRHLSAASETPDLGMASSLNAFKARLDGAIGSLVWWVGGSHAHSREVGTEWCLMLIPS